MYKIIKAVKYNNIIYKGKQIDKPCIYNQDFVMYNMYTIYKHYHCDFLGLMTVD